jgi:hypothetical protein
MYRARCGHFAGNTGIIRRFVFNLLLKNKSSGTGVKNKRLYITE